MMKGAVAPRLSHIRKSIQKIENTMGWMNTMEEDHLSCWSQYLSASRALESALEPRVLDQLADRLKLPHAFSGAGVHSPVHSANEEFMGSFAVIATALVSFCKNINLPVYIRITEALEEIDSLQPAGFTSATVTKVREVSNRLQALGTDITEKELESASQLVKGHMQVEVPGVNGRVLMAPESIRPPDPRGLADFINAPCNTECVILKQRRHIQQAHIVLSALDPMRNALMRVSVGKFGLDSS